MEGQASAVPRPLTILAALPTALQQCIVAFVQEPAVLLELALSCRALYSVVTGLPRWHASGLVGGYMFHGTPVPMCRALSILLYGRCELCHHRSGPGFLWSSFRVYAHAVCVDRELINACYLTKNQLPRLQAGRAMVLRRYPPPAMGVYWKREHPCIDPIHTVEGAEVLTLAQAAAAGDACWRTHVAEQRLAGEMCAVARAREAHRSAARLSKAAAATQRRRAALATALAAAQLPAREAMGQHKFCIRQFLALRVSTPYSVKEAVTRLRAAYMGGT